MKGSRYALGLLPVLFAFLACSSDSGSTKEAHQRVSGVASPSAELRLELPDGTHLIIPAGAVSGDLHVALDREGEAPAGPDWATPVGTGVIVDLQGQTLLKPATLELPYDAARLPQEMGEDQIFAAYYDESIGAWSPVGGIADPQRHVVTVELTHASWWEPWSWITDAIVQGIVTAFKLDWGSVADASAAFAGCSPTSSGVIIDEAENKDYLGSCVEVDDALKPRLRIVNRRTFDVKVHPLGPSVPIDPPSLGEPLQRLGKRSFTANFTGVDVRVPLALYAEVDWPYTLGHALLDMIDLIPGIRVALNSDVGAKIILEVYKNQHVVSAANALSAGDTDGFWREFSIALGDSVLIRRIASMIVEGAPKGSLLSKIDPKFLGLIFQGLRVLAIRAQILDASTHARDGGGTLRVYSNRPIVPAGASTPQEAVEAWLRTNRAFAPDSVGACPARPPYMNGGGGRIWSYKQTGDPASWQQQIDAGRTEFFFGFCGADAEGYLTVVRSGAIWAAELCQACQRGLGVIQPACGTSSSTPDGAVQSCFVSGFRGNCNDVKQRCAVVTDDIGTARVYATEGASSNPPGFSVITVRQSTDGWAASSVVGCGDNFRSCLTAPGDGNLAYTRWSLGQSTSNGSSRLSVLMLQLFPGRGLKLAVALTNETASSLNWTPDSGNPSIYLEGPNGSKHSLTQVGGRFAESGQFPPGAFWTGWLVFDAAALSGRFITKASPSSRPA